MADPKVLLGVTGCIAAYKSCEIVRGLQKAGVDVEVVMTESAKEFVGPVTFEALTHKPVRSRVFGDSSEPIPHIALAERCDLFLVAPCTADVIAKIAVGIADDLLTSTALAAHDRLVVAPAMNVHMYEAPATQANLATLRERGVVVVESGSGYQACGDVGRGRLADVGEVIDAVLDMLGCTCDLAGMKVMVTAGPTVERIDPVRYITNDSSGKMGYALVEAALRRGAEVTLVSGPCAISPPSQADVVEVESAEEMMKAAKAAFSDADIAVFAAAVCDMRPACRYDSKIKKSAGEHTLRMLDLRENPDILATLASRKIPGQYVIGFAAETDDVITNAKRKLLAKHADMIVANEVGSGKAFGYDEEVASIVTASGVIDLPMMSKIDLANRIFDEACANMS